MSLEMEPKLVDAKVRALAVLAVITAVTPLMEMVRPTRAEPATVPPSNATEVIAPVYPD